MVCVGGRGAENGGRGLFTESIRADSLGREKARIIMLESGSPALLSAETTV